MSILHLISQDGHIVLNKQLIKLFGFYEAGIVGLFASVHNYNQLTIPDYDGWFYVTYEKIENNLSLTEEKSKNPIQKLEKAGVFFTKKKGVPCRKFFKFNQDRLLDLLVPSSTRKIRGQEAGKSGDKKRGKTSTSTHKKPLQAGGKSGRNNKTNKKTFSLSEEVEKLIGEREFFIDLEKLQKWLDRQEAFKYGKNNAIASWVEKPENQIRKLATKTDPKEITALRSKIKSIVNKDYDWIFGAQPIEKTDIGYKIIVSDPKALKYEEALKNIVRIEFEK